MGAEPPSHGPPLSWEQGRGLPPTLGCTGGESRVADNLGRDKFGVRLEREAGAR